MEAHLNEGGKRATGRSPADLAERAAAEHEALVEAVAEGEDDLMEKFFAQGTLEPQDILPGLKREIVERKIFPVLCASSCQRGRRAPRSSTPAWRSFPLRKAARTRAIGKDGKPVMVFCNEKDHAVAQVFKTVSDPFAGRISYLRVLAGHFQSDGNYWNATKGVHERFSGLFLPQGKEHVNVPEARAGDIVAVAKLKETHDGRHADDQGPSRRAAEALRCPEASIAYAIEPKAKGDEDKISTALHKLIEEDPSLNFQRDEETKEFHLAGASQLHVEIAVARLKKRYGVEVILHPPKVPYRETITKKAEAHGRHKKQTGGHGQFADCRISVEPLARGKDFEFVDDIYGGSIPRNFIPAVEKGIQEVRKKGFLAGYPMVDFRVILYDGQYHDVDSSELAFKLAGRARLQGGDGRGEAHAPRARDERRDHRPQRIRRAISWATSRPAAATSRAWTRPNDDTVIKAAVPMAELLTYGANLRSITQGRGSFHLEFSHYAEVPHALQEKVIAQSKAGKGGEAKEA